MGRLLATARSITNTFANGRSAYDVVPVGPSNSASVATGVAVLIFSIRFDLAGRQVKQIPIKSVRRVPGSEPRLVTGGVIDAFAAVTSALRYGK